MFIMKIDFECKVQFDIVIPELLADQSPNNGLVDTNR